MEELRPSQPGDPAIEDRIANRAPRIIVVTGPTATGKTAIAHRLALDLDGELVNADSVQIYRHVNVGTGKPSSGLRSERSYHLLDIRNPDEPFDAQQFRRLAAEAIRSILDRGHSAIVVGGTGFYIRSLLYGLFEGAGRDPEIRARLESRLKAEGSASLYAELRVADPATAGKLHPNDSQRLVRALEVWLSTGRPISAWREDHRFAEHPFDPRLFVLQVPREELRKRIDRRVEHMLSEGWVEEVQELLNRGYDERCRPLHSIGYAQLLRVCRGDLSLEEAVSLIQKETSEFARRQTTWYRKEKGANWISPDRYDVILGEARLFLEKHGSTLPSV
ncbi:MAG: tRNA (adenosine(37)-N6)-dimethylallyltransferase MiaA [Nitrospirae bacterium]|nr:tRNA (adenosine(37)-N6)-dimethylallyltransferase MiaA [Nitrospirota bacterium]